MDNVSKCCEGAVSKSEFFPKYTGCSSHEFQFPHLQSGCAEACSQDSQKTKCTGLSATHISGLRGHASGTGGGRPRDAPGVFQPRPEQGAGRIGRRLSAAGAEGHGACRCQRQSKQGLQGGSPEKQSSVQPARSHCTQMSTKHCREHPDERDKAVVPAMEEAELQLCAQAR